MVRSTLQSGLILGGLFWFISVGGYNSWWALPAGSMFMLGLDWRYGFFAPKKANK